MSYSIRQAGRQAGRQKNNSSSSSSKDSNLGCRGLCSVYRSVAGGQSIGGPRQVAALDPLDYANNAHWLLTSSSSSSTATATATANTSTTGAWQPGAKNGPSRTGEEEEDVDDVVVVNDDESFSPAARSLYAATMSRRRSGQHQHQHQHHNQHHQQQSQQLLDAGKEEEDDDDDDEEEQQQQLQDVDRGGHGSEHVAYYDAASLYPSSGESDGRLAWLPACRSPASIIFLS